MMTVLGLALALFVAEPVQEQVPRACQPDARGVVEWLACYEASPEGSMARRYALINMGTEAYLAGDYAQAVRHYDEAAEGGNTIYSDPFFHAFRADAYDHVGRSKEALEEARIAFAMMDGVEGPWTQAAAGMPPLEDAQKAAVFALILPVLKDGRDPAFARALAAYQRLPAADWMAQAQRATTLEQLGDFDGALAASREAMKAQPNEPGLENNHCYILTRAGRAAEALPFCERAVAGLPNAAPIRHSLAATLAQLGRCEEAEAALAEAARLDPSSALYRQPIACKPV